MIAKEVFTYRNGLHIYGVSHLTAEHRQWRTWSEAHVEGVVERPGRRGVRFSSFSSNRYTTKTSRQLALKPFFLGFYEHGRNCVDVL